MKTIKLSQAPRPLAEYTDELDDEIVVLMKTSRQIGSTRYKNCERSSLTGSG